MIAACVFSYEHKGCKENEAFAKTAEYYTKKTSESKIQGLSQ